MSSAIASPWSTLVQAPTTGTPVKASIDASMPGAAIARPVGCPAGATSPLVVALKQFGLPISDAFYNDAYPAAPTGHRKMLL
jgi:hypothetical protein